MIGTLAMMAVSLIVMARALAEEDLWTAGLGAFFAVLLSISLRRDKRSLDGRP